MLIYSKNYKRTVIPDTNFLILLTRDPSGSFLIPAIVLIMKLFEIFSGSIPGQHALGITVRMVDETEAIHDLLLNAAVYKKPPSFFY